MVKPKKHKERKLSSYKKAAWDAFSVFIRRRDCLATTGDPDWGKCVTCKKMYAFNQLQAGHFIPGRGNAILFEPTCVHAQCGACNTWGNKATHDGRGCPIAYTAFMREKYGEGEILRLYDLARQTRQFSKNEYIAIREYYEEETRELTQVFKETTPKI